MPPWINNVYNLADAEGSITDWIAPEFPRLPHTDAETKAAAQKPYNFVYRQSAAATFLHYPFAVWLLN
jgi:hypothetical protein